MTASPLERPVPRRRARTAADDAVDPIDVPRNTGDAAGAVTAAAVPGRRPGAA